MSRYWTPKVYEGISKHPDAERQIDQEVAEKVLGWKRWEHPSRGLYTVAPTVKRERYGIALSWKRASPAAEAFCDSRRWVPFFSTRIEDAFLVVAEMERRFGFAGYNGFTLMKKGEERWYCEFPAPNWMSGEGESPAEAVARAALAAVTGEETP